MAKSRTYLLLLVSFFCVLYASAQDKSNRGREFWLGYGFHWIMTNSDNGGTIPVNSQDMALYISTELPATVTVSVNGTAWTQTLTIPANTVNATIVVPKSGANDARIMTDGLSARGIHIVSDVPVAVYAHVYVNQGSGATMLMPVDTYGYSYFSVNYNQHTSASPLPVLAANTANGPDWYSWFYVVASEDNTRIQITPSDSTKNGWLPGQNYTVNLNKGEIYTVFGKMVPNNNQPWAASKDMTGSKVISLPGTDGNCHPFAFFSGSSGIRICRGDGGEYMQQQVFPAQAWGTRYLTYHTINNGNTDLLETNRNYYRICVSDPTAVVRRNGTPLTGLIRNFYYEIMDSTGGDYIESDKPVLVSQYTVNDNQCWNYPVTNPSPPSFGDPEMFYLSPLEQGQKAVRLFASRQSPAVSYVYTNIILRTTGVPSLRVDGNPLPATQIITHPNKPDYSVALARFIGAAAQHTITSDSSLNASIYGLGNYESYGYNAGTLINNLNYYSDIKNSFSTLPTDTFTCPKTPVRLFLKVGQPANSIHWKLSQVTGITPNVDSIITNPVPIRTEQINGRTYYVYTLQQDFTFATAGTYFIPVSYTSTVIENCNQTENAQVKVVVKPGPVADFTYTPACLLDPVQFTGTPTAGTFNLTSYTWFFPDNTTANTINSIKAFTTPGNHDVRFRVLADNGCAGDTTKTITVLYSPAAVFTATGNICQRDSVRITDASTITVGTISSWRWDFGDGNTSVRSNNTAFYHTYANPGNYIISLVTIAASGCKSDTAFVPVTVLPRPTANFTTGGNVCLGDSIRFIDQSAPVPAGTLTSWHWNYGDNNSEIRNNNTPFYHTYTSTGNFNVTLVVTGSNTCSSDTFRLTVNVSSKPPATFTVAGKPCVDSLFSFTSSVAAGGTNPPTWYWNFGDNQTGSSTVSNSITHAYSTAAPAMVVKHWVSYAAGCASDTAYGNLPVIIANPVAAFTITGDTLCEKKPITLNSTVTGTHFWNWNLGPTTSNARPPFTHSFANAGTYSIRLFLSNPEGCNSSPVSQSITINPIPAINAGPDKMINAGASTTIDASILNAGNYNFLWTPATYLNAANILNPVSTPDISTLYTIEAIDKLSNCIGTDQVLISPITGLYIPSAFTPNGDGKNDSWEIPGLALYPEARVIIYNRGGQAIYDRKSYTSNPWNGNFNGTRQPVAVYVYMIQLNDAAKRVLKGTVTIIR